MQPKLKVGPLVDVLVQRIVAGEADARLKWLEPGRRVRVLVDKVIPSTSADSRPLAKDTLAGRQRRMILDLEPKLSAAGWSKASGTAPHTYVNKPTE
jgi:hypothetical protein